MQNVFVQVWDNARKYRPGSNAGAWIMKITRNASMDKKSMKELDHCSRKKMDGTVITITANYDDGTTASKQCVLKLDTDTWEIKAVEK